MASENIRLVEGSKNLAKLVGGPVDVLDFSGTATGTHKLLKAERAFERFPRAKEFVAITSGNYGAALKHVAEREEKRVYLIMNYARKDLFDKLEGPFTEVHPLEDLQRCLTRGGNTHHGIFPVPMGYPILLNEKLVRALNLHLFYHHDDEVRTNDPANITGNQEIYGQNPHRSDLVYNMERLGISLKGYDHLVVPSGSGELFHDLAKQTSVLSNSLGVLPKGHPLITKATFDLNAPASVADKLTTPIAPMGGVIDALRKHEGRNIGFVEATEEELVEANRLALSEGLDSEISGSAAFVMGVRSFRRRNRAKTYRTRKERTLLVNTGNGEEYLSRL